MKFEKFSRYTVINCVSGTALTIAGILLAVFFTIPQGITPVLPFVLAGIGLLYFIGGLSGVITIRLMKKDADLLKQIKITDNDERNIAIDNKAKANTHDFTSLLISALIIFLAAMQVQILVILVFVGATFLRTLVFFFLMRKYRKEY